MTGRGREGQSRCFNTFPRKDDGPSHLWPNDEGIFRKNDDFAYARELVVWYGCKKYTISRIIIHRRIELYILHFFLSSIIKPFSASEKRLVPFSEFARNKQKDMREMEELSSRRLNSLTEIAFTLVERT
jgi:hypothetical protein